MKSIELTQGKIAIVDDADFELVNGHSWYAVPGKKTYYAIRYKRASNGAREFMHTLITGWSFVDHINGDGLNNQRENLRLATTQQNAWNANHSHGVSKYKGVHWASYAGKWRARLEINGKKVHVGYYKTEVEAALAYNAEATKRFGEYAYLNKI